MLKRAVNYEFSAKYLITDPRFNTKENIKIGKELTYPGYSEQNEIRLTTV